MSRSLCRALARRTRCQRTTTSLLALAALGLLVLAAPAAAITPTNDAAALGAAAMRSPASLASAAWDVPAYANASAVATEAIADFPANGSNYVVLSSGNAALAPNASQGGANASNNNAGGTRGGAQNVVALRLNLTVPSGTNCVSMKFRFFSEEYPEYVGQGFNDGFLAELDPTSPWTMTNHAISAPDNFAFMPGGAFVSINSATMTAADAAGTIYDGGTQLLTAATPVTPGGHSLVLSVWDDGDTSYDSAAFIDDVAVFNTAPGGCTEGATPAPSDDTPPETTIDTAPSPTTGASTSVAFSADETGSSFECKIDTGGWTACGTPASLTGLTTGPHTFQVRATDAAGNTDATPASTTWTVDATPPDTTISSGPPAATTATSATFAFDAGEIGATYECKLDTGAWAACLSGDSFGSLAEGPHSFNVRATDTYGNVDPTPATSSWTVDVTAPTVTIGGGPAALTSSTSADFTLSADEGGVTLECRLDTATWAPCTSPHALTGLADGQHTLRVRGTDAAGNVSNEPTHTWTVDTVAPTAPAVDLATAPTALSSDAAPTVTFTGEAGGTFQCRLDGGVWNACSSPLKLNGLADGEHALQIRQADDAGNWSPETTHTWVVDTTPPDAPTILAGPEGTVATGTTAAFAFAGEPGATLQCRLDGGDWTPCGTSYDLPGPGTGEHTLEVRQIDGAGNIGPTAERHWTIQPDAAPDVETATTLTGTVGTTDATHGTTRTAVVEGGVLPVGCRVDSGSIKTCTVEVWVDGKMVGTGTVTYDEAGTRSGRVEVRLSAAIRARLQQARKPVTATFVFEATTFGHGGSLKTRTTAILRPSAQWILPSDGLFEVASARLVPKVRRYLRSIAPLLRDAKVVRCEGHTDSRGGRAANLRLGLRRAKGVCAELRGLGVNARLVAVSRGESRPRASNATKAGRWRNRRVALRVVR